MTEALTLAEYQAQALLTDQRRTSDPALAFALLGLFGETGSLLSEVKKKQRDPVSYRGYQDSVVEELGDTLWYLTAVADRGHVALSELGANLDRTLEDWQGSPADNLTFQELQPEAPPLQSGPSPAFERTLLQLAGEVGLLLTDHEAGRLTRNKAALFGRLLAILRTLRAAAHDAGVTLEAAARANLDKIFDRWPQKRVYPVPFDANCPPQEQLPRQFIVEICEVYIEGRPKACLIIDGRPIGDPLTDNRQEDDDYRFHDVFHLAHAAILGWSPSFRRLLRRKRKSLPAIDEAEDGARAVLIEEGVATWIFNHAQRLAFFENVKALDYGLLKTVREFVHGYEAAHSPLWLWEETILQGYTVFRNVRAARGGIITGSLTDRTIRWAPR